MSITLRSLGQIAVDLTEAMNWLEEIQVPYKESRVEKLSDFIFHRLMNSSTSESTDLESGAVSPRIYYALVDAAALGLIAREFRRLPSSRIPRRTIRDAIQGPLDPADENSSNNQARNKLVELELAAHLLSTGHEITGFDDLSITFEGVSYSFECKRPVGLSAVTSNMEKAYHQLSSKLKTDADRGIVAMAVEKPFGLDGKCFNLDNESSIARFSAEFGSRFGELAAHGLGSLPDIRIVAALAIIRYLFRLQCTSTVAVTYTLAMIKLASEHAMQNADIFRLDRLIGRIRNAFNDEQK